MNERQAEWFWDSIEELMDSWGSIDDPWAPRFQELTVLTMIRDLLTVTSNPYHYISNVLDDYVLEIW